MSEREQIYKAAKNMFALVDCNNFFVSCERLFNPKLNRKPVVVLSSNDGCVIARSNEAKKINIPMGIPVHKVKHLIQRHGVVLISSNHHLYADISQRVMRILSEETKDLEVYSVDEAFLSIPDQDHLYEFAKHLRNKLMQWVGIPVSVGIAKTKTLAKIANIMAKTGVNMSKLDIPRLDMPRLDMNGICILDNDQKTKDILENWPIEDVWGVGYRWAEKLRMQGCGTALDLCHKPDEWIKRHLGVMGLRMAYELRSIPCYTLENMTAPRKSMIVSRSFGDRITRLDDLKHAVGQFITRACEKLRKEELLAQGVCVFIRSNPYAIKAPQHRESAEELLTVPSDYTPDFIRVAFNLLENIFQPKIQYKKAGIGLFQFIPKGNENQHMFEQRNHQRQDHLMRAIDQINQKMGRNTIVFATSHGQNRWQPSAQLRSPCYTSCWSDIPEVG